MSYLSESESIGYICWAITIISISICILIGCYINIKYQLIKPMTIEQCKEMCGDYK